MTAKITIIDGPAWDRIVDSLRYANDNRARIPVTFQVRIHSQGRTVSSDAKVRSVKLVNGRDKIELEIQFTGYLKFAARGWYDINVRMGELSQVG